jgi:glycosyltransferase involved in cell wall biosynthesis
MREFIESKGLTKTKKLSVIGQGSTNGIDVNRFNAASLDEKKIAAIEATIQYSDEHIYLLCIGRLVVDKGIVELINVFISLQKTNPAVKLVLVGDYENALYPLPSRTVSEIENNPGIVHISWTNDVEYYMHIADHFIFPSRREGFPNVLLQAGAMELPIVCSRIVGNIDIVTHHETGLIFEDGNEGEMLEMIRYALANPQAVQTMAQRLKQVINENFRRENIWQNMLAAYKSLVN